jgi:hypothetical protein
MEAIKQISTNIQDGFRSLQIPANVITYSLLTRVEGQYQGYLKRMTIQMAAESNDIFKTLLRDTEDTINNIVVNDHEGLDSDHLSGKPFKPSNRLQQPWDRHWQPAFARKTCS